MIDKIYTCRLDLSKAERHSIPNMTFSISDERTSIILFEIINGDITGAKIDIYIEKPDGHTVFNPVLQEEGQLMYVLTAQSKAITGSYTGELRIQIGDEVRAIKGINYTIEASIINETAIESTDEYGVLTQLIVDVREINDVAVDAAIKALASEVAANSSKLAAKLSEDNAKLSETNAMAMEYAAALSATAAELAQLAAKLSEDNSKASEDKSKLSETEAKKSETAAKASEQAAALSEIASNLSEIAAKLSEDNAKLSELSALDSKNVTIQAMTDYLAMLGVDVATLVDGKVPVSQIPFEVTFDIVEITDESELTSLAPEQVQRNDLAVIIEGIAENKVMVKSFKLLGDGNPANRENWVRVAVEYASIAGHATTAGTAENANKINNHRLIVMSQTQYDQAAIENGTLYVVFPDEE